MTDVPELPDNARPNADGHGHAALVLVESLIHGLADQKVITVGQALDIMEVALEAQQAIADDHPPPADAMKHATVLLGSLIRSLRTEELAGPGGGPAAGNKSRSAPNNSD